MSEAAAAKGIIVWYLFFLGSARCWAELWFMTRLSGKKIRPAMSLLYIAASRLPAALCLWMGIAQYGNLLLMGVLLLFSIRVFRVPPGNALLCCGMIFVLNTFFEGFLELLMNPISATLDLPHLFAGVVVQVLVSILLLAGLLAAFAFISGRYPLGEAGVPASTLLTLLPCALIVWAVQLVMQPEDGGSGAAQLEPAYAALIWMCVSVVAFFSVLAANHKTVQLLFASQEKRLLERECRIQAQGAREAARRWEDTRAYQHDVRNHLLVVSGLLKRKLYREAGGYLDTLVSAAEELVPSVTTGSAALDILLEEKLRFARREGIAVTVDLQMHSPGNMDEMDLCVLFANSLDNAVHACMAMPDGQRLMDIAVRRRRDLLLVQVENSAVADTPPVVYGTGLQNIRRIARKYSGSMQVEKRGERFRLSVLLSCVREG